MQTAVGVFGGKNYTNGTFRPCLVVEVEKIRWPELYVFGCDSGNIGGRG